MEAHGSRLSTHAGRIVAAMRIVVDMTPLSLEQTGIPNYLTGMVRGLVEVSGEHSIVAFAPTGPRGSRRVAAALSDLPIEKRILSLPGAYYWRALWSRFGRIPESPMSCVTFSCRVILPNFTKLRSKAWFSSRSSGLSGRGSARQTALSPACF